MNKKAKEQYNITMYNAVKSALVENKNDINALKSFKSFLIKDKNLYVDMKNQLIIFVDAFIFNYNNNNKVKITAPKVFKPINNTISAAIVEKVENKILKIKSLKLQNEFIGLLNLLNDNNLIYNALYIRENILSYLNKFKSLKFFKVNYISTNNLNSKYAFLSYKNDSIKFYSKVFFINNIIILKTLNHDNITLKAFYLNKNDIKFLFKENTKENMFIDELLLNYSAIDYKTINDELSADEKIYFYTYHKKHALNKNNRALLKQIRKSVNITDSYYKYALNSPLLSFEKLEDENKTPINEFLAKDTITDLKGYDTIKGAKIQLKVTNHKNANKPIYNKNKNNFCLYAFKINYNISFGVLTIKSKIYGVNKVITYNKRNNKYNDTDLNI